MPVMHHAGARGRRRFGAPAIAALMILLQASAVGAAQPPGTSISATKTMTGHLVKTFGWTIAKTATPSTFTRSNGESATVAYRVTLAKNAGTLSGYFDGNICVTNTGSVATQGLAISDALSRPPSKQTLATVSVSVALRPVLAAGASFCYPYRINIPANAVTPGAIYKDTATVTITNKSGPNSGPAPSSTATLPTTVGTTVNDTVHVTDTNGGSWTFSASGFQTYNKTFNCDANAGINNNTATITETGQSASGAVTATCLDPDVRITKTVDHATATGGDTIIYTMTVSNAGPGVALGVSLSDTLPAGISASIDNTTDFSLSGSALTLNGQPLASLASGTSKTVHVTGTVPASACETTMTNTATVAATNELAAQQANDSASASTAVSCFALEVTKSPDAVAVTAGDPVGYTITVDNNGASSAAGVTLTDTLPTNAGLSWTIDPPVGGCSILTGTLTCLFGTVAAGGSAFVHITSPTTTVTCGTISNVATATTTSAAGTATSGPVGITVICPGINVIKTPDVSETSIGATVTYTFVVTNTGDTPLSVVLSDPKCDAGTLSGPSGDTNGDSKLDTTETWTYTCTHLVTAGDGDPLHNVVTATGTDSQGGQDTDTDEADVDVLHPGINVIKTPDVSETSIGATVTYTFVVTNTGDTPLSVVLSDPQCDAGTLSGPSGDTNGDSKLDTTETWTYTCTHLVTAGDGDPLHNVVTATGTDSQGGQDTDTDETDVDIIVEEAPTVTTTTPTDGATDVAPNTNVTVNFSESVNYSSASFDILCGLFTHFAFTLSTTSPGTSATLDPTTDLPSGATCTVTVVTAEVTDTDALDPPDNMAANYVFSFTMADVAPTVTTTAPTNGATIVASNTNITVTFSESVNYAASSFTVECPTASAQAFTLTTTSPGTMATLDPTADLPAGTVCTVTVVAANVTDTDAIDPPNEMAANYVFSFTIDAAPTVTATSPTNGAKSVAAATNITVNFSESVNYAAGSFTLECPSASPQAFTLTTTSPGASATLDPTANLPLGQFCQVTVLAAGITDVDAGDPPDNMALNYVFSFGVAPDAVDDTYPQTVIGNVSINSANIPYSASTNDVSAIPVTITAFDTISAQGGNVTMTTSGADIGKFTYNPPAGYEGADSFTYTIGNAAGSDTATVSLSVSGMVWFINNAAGPGDGRLSSPFNTLAAFTSVNNGVGSHPAASDNIFVYESSTSYTGGTTLLGSQRLIGQDSTASLATITGLTPPSGSASFPAMNTAAPTTTITNAAGTGITLANDVVIRGLTVSATSGAGILGVSITSATVGSDVAVSGATGAALDLSGAGTGTIAFGAGITNTAGQAVRIENRTGGTVSLTGPISDVGGTGIFLNGNTGATIIFSGGMSLSTGASAAFTATSSGTIEATQNNTTIVNSLITTTGRPLQVSNTIIGAGDLTFRSISANGSPNGVLLATTGSVGNLVITGIGTTAGSGGLIQNTTGAGVSLSSTLAPSLSNLTIQNTGSHGIVGTSVAGLTLTGVQILGAGDGDGENSINLTNSTGTTLITGSTLSDATENHVSLTNSNTNATLEIASSTLKILGGTFGNNAVEVFPNGTSVLTVNIHDSTFEDIKNTAVTFGAQTLGSSNSSTLTFNGNTINQTSAGHGGAVFVSGQESTTAVATITNNDWLNGVGGNGLVNFDTNDSSTVRATVTGNTVASAPAAAFVAAVDDAGTLRVRFDNNVVTNSGGDGFQIVNFGGPGVSTLSAIVTNNTVNGNSQVPAQAFSGGMGIYAFEDTNCANVSGNTVTGTPVGFFDILLDGSGSTSFLYQNAGIGATAAAHVIANNPAASNVSVTASTLSNGVACAAP